MSNKQRNFRHYQGERTSEQLDEIKPNMIIAFKIKPKLGVFSAVSYKNIKFRTFRGNLDEITFFFWTNVGSYLKLLRIKPLISAFVYLFCLDVSLEASRPQIMSTLWSDISDSGNIEFNEFLTLITSKITEDTDSEETVRQAFQLFDQDNDGFITVNEL